jgi:hypothetical protein
MIYLLKRFRKKGYGKRNRFRAVAHLKELNLSSSIGLSKNTLLLYEKNDAFSGHYIMAPANNRTAKSFECKIFNPAIAGITDSPG